MVERDRDLHIFVLNICITMSQEHDLIMMSHVVVRYGDGCGCEGDINESIIAVSQWAMIDPYVLWSTYGDTIPLRRFPKPNMVRRVSYHGITNRFTVMNVDAMYDDVVDIMDGDAPGSGDVDARTPSVDGLVGVHD